MTTSNIEIAFWFIIALIIYSLFIGSIETYCSNVKTDAYYNGLNQTVGSAQLNETDNAWTSPLNFVSTLSPFNNSCDFSIWMKLPFYAMFMLLLFYIVPIPFKST
jgi:hypothetical protein